VASDNDVRNTMAGDSDTNSSSSNEDLEHINNYLIETLTNNIGHFEKKRTKLSTRFRNTFTSGDSEEEMLESQNVINKFTSKCLQQRKSSRLNNRLLVKKMQIYLV